MTFSERLNRLLARDGLLQKDLAAKLGISPQAVQFWASGRNMPRRPMVIRIADYFRVSPAWLAGDIEGGDPNNLVKTLDGDDIIAVGGAAPEDADLIPVYKYNLCFTAGAGGVAPEWVEVSGSAHIYTANELRGLGVAPERAKIAEVSGDSMFPTILDGDEILFEEYSDSRLGAQPIVDGGIYTISIGDDMKVKRLSKIKNGIRVRSDNSDAYPDEIYAGEECDQIRVYGRVVQLLRSV